MQGGLEQIRIDCLRHGLMGTVGKYVTLSVTYFLSVTYTLLNVTYSFSSDPTNKLGRT